VASLRTSNVNKKSEDEERIVQLCNYTDVYYNDRIMAEIDFMQATASEAEIERFSLQLGDVVITKDSESPDDIGIPAVIAEQIDDLVCGYHLTILRPFESVINGRYLSYALVSRVSAYQFYLAANGVTRFGLTYQGTKNLRIAFPSLTEQEKIANYLDHKTAQVDSLIAKKKELIEKLKEQRVAIITQAVTKGPDPNAPMRDSGIDWLGQVPDHWQVIPLGFLITIAGGMTPSLTNPNFWDGDIPWVTPKDMKQERISDSLDHITDFALTETSISLIEEGAVLIVVRGMILAHSFPTAITETRVTVNQDMKALRCGELLEVEYLFRALAGFAKTLSSFAQESAHGTRKMETYTLKKLWFPVPPLAEQIAIARYLKESLAKLDQLSSATIQTIERLTEYRTALITAATSGKIDVRGVKVS
jgi:type I restriction enzyme S subunit